MKRVVVLAAEKDKEPELEVYSSSSDEKPVLRVSADQLTLHEFASTLNGSRTCVCVSSHPWM